MMDDKQHSEVVSLLSQLAELEEVARQVQDAAGRRLPQLREDLANRLEGAKESLLLSLEQLKPNFERLFAVSEQLTEVVAEQLPVSMEIVRERLSNALDSTREIIEEKCLEQTEETVHENLERAKAAVGIAKARIEEEFQLLADEAENSAKAMESALEAIREPWTSKVTSVTRSFEKMMEQFQGVGNDAAEIMEAMDISIRSTSMATAAAGSVLQEIKGALEAVS